MTKLYDVSWPIRTGGVVYPQNPPIDIQSVASIAAGATANGSRISFGSHTGTHIDAQKHFDDRGTTVDAVPLDVLIGPAMLVRVPDNVMAITAEHVRAAKLDGQSRVLFATRNSAFIKLQSFVPDYTYIAPDAAEMLVAMGVQLVGVDYLSIEQFHSGHHLTHKTLLRAGVAIIEGLDLSIPPAGQYELMCLPLLLVGLDGAPARAVLRAL